MNQINYFYMQHHRRLREKFGIERVCKHEAKVMAALDKRFATVMDKEPQ